jgi:hypothetical protein
MLRPSPLLRPLTVVAVWSPSHATFRGADREMGAKLVFKAHESGVLGMTLFSSYSDGTQPPFLKLASTGGCHLGGWGVGGGGGGGGASGGRRGGGGLGAWEVVV